MQASLVLPSRQPVGVERQVAAGQQCAETVCKKQLKHCGAACKERPTVHAALRLTCKGPCQTRRHWQQQRQSCQLLEPHAKRLCSQDILLVASRLDSPASRLDSPASAAAAASLRSLTCSQLTSKSTRCQGPTQDCVDSTSLQDHTATALSAGPGCYSIYKQSRAKTASP